jgi:Xaa-Pro aminopeptidase
MTFTLPPIEVGQRWDRLVAQLDDPLYVTTLSNVRWLTGFSGSNGQVLVRRDGTGVLFTDGRYGEQSRAEVAAAGGADRIEIVVTTSVAAGVEAKREATAPFARVGVEADAVTLAAAAAMRSSWSAELVETVGVVAELRRAKDVAEIARMERAASLIDGALAELLPMLNERVTEQVFARAVESWIVDHGADGWAYDPIVGSGPNGALAHHRAGDRIVQDGDLVVLDLGAMVDGYRSDMTRTIPVGDVPAESAALLEAATAAQASGVAVVRDGVSAHDIDEACRVVLRDAGLEDLLNHGTGHSVGLDIHEPPILRPGADVVIASGNVTTVEPGVYRPGLGGARVEDLVLVTADGCRSLTATPKVVLP